MLVFFISHYSYTVCSDTMIITTMSNSWRASLQQIVQKLDYDRAWSSQEWKAEAMTYDRSGRPDKTSWRLVRQVRPDLEEILLDGTAQSVRYGETLRDRSGRPDNINSQEVANSRNFIMGNTIGIVCRIKIIRESGE